MINVRQPVLHAVTIVFVLLSSWIAIPCFATHYVTVGPGNEDFGNLHAAISSLPSYVGEDTEAVIQISDNTYVNTATYVINFSSFNFSKLSIESANGYDNCILQSTTPNPVPYFGTVFHVVGNQSKEFIIRDITMATMAENYPIYYQTATLRELHIEGCNLMYPKQAIEIANGYGESDISIVNNCFNDDFPSGANQPGAGIYITAAYSYLNLTISNNEINDYIKPILVNAVNHNTLISNNLFTSPSQLVEISVIQIDDIIWNQNSNFSILDNVFINTIIDTDRVSGEIADNVFLATNPYLSYFIWCLNWDDDGVNTQLMIRRNLFYGTNTNTCIYAPTNYNIDGSVDMKIENNSFLNVGTAVKIELAEYYQENQISSFKNNFIQCSSEPMVLLTYGTITPSIPVQINHSMFVNGYPANSSYFIVDSQTCPTGNPYINMDTENCTYTLIWNEAQRSPLIMAGYGNEGLGSPYHSNRLDIGSVQYSEYPHEYVTYTFPPYSQRNGLKWMSFPTLDRIWNPTTNEPDVANTFFMPIRDTEILNSITWKEQDDNAQDIHFASGSWVGDLSHYIIPEQGYKIQMAQGLQNEQSIAVPGIIPSVDQYPLTLKAFSSSKAPKPDNENWLGYFHSATVNALDAFTGILDNLWFIQTQNWTMVRENMSPGSPWIIAYQNGKEPTLSYGDMVIVKCFEDAQFCWNTTPEDQIPIEKELPKHYLYEEKPDYVPMYVEMDAANLPGEIALFVNDVCIGAAVVCDSLVEVPAYILDNPDPNAEVEIRVYYADKAAVDQIPAFRVWNNTSGAYENKPLVLNRKNYYYKVKLAKGEGETPVASLATMEIYPNPFNPSTTIRFNLPEVTEIKLEVYNLKGQLVRTLAKGIADSGRQSVSWDGTDNQNKRVASGLYYSKLSYQNKTFVKKMVMMK
ncbi:MAG: FlgD immunoglobulin-like domain containing protein [Candidatus Cloacimonetes bacterium]|nr:FlgD immunoglobulin-like domain containing protein [Candidatus Cloacimonadota bacterium]